MSQKLGQKPQPETPNEVQGRDLFQTPRYAIELLLPFIPKQITKVWECSCGDGRIAKVLEETYYVFCTDIRDNDNWVDQTLNFVTEEFPYDIDERWAIITNPPFSITKKYYNKCVEYGLPFALLINANYKQWVIDAVRIDGCEKIIPTSRISFITPNVVGRVNAGEGTGFVSVDGIPNDILYKYSSSDFHSMWLTWGFNLGRTETFIDLTVQQRKENIK